MTRKLQTCFRCACVLRICDSCHAPLAPPHRPFSRTRAPCATLRGRRHVVWFPESAATIIVGLAVGLILRFGFSVDVRAAASFNGEFFMLALLPVIIFESGYSLELQPFFTQLWSVLAFALIGTTISAFVIGGLLFWAGSQSGWGVLSLTFEEAMAFASLLSATDPVATLVVFSGLKAS